LFLKEKHVSPSWWNIPSQKGQWLIQNWSDIYVEMISDSPHGDKQPCKVLRNSLLKSRSVCSNFYDGWTGRKQQISQNTDFLPFGIIIKRFIYYFSKTFTLHLYFTSWSIYKSSINVDQNTCSNTNLTKSN
jgi:hypothetical protein